MIKIVKGDVLQATEDIIIHQVNCQGVMGSGVAYQIKMKHPEVYHEYKKFCNKFSDEILLGATQFVNRQQDNKIICNLFGQKSFGIGLQTDYHHLKWGLGQIKNMVMDKENILFEKTLAMPYNIGCGAGGGDWNIVYKILEDVFQNITKPYDVTLYDFNKKTK
jgi:O-acetyl-ADP-ribose deacetylase (regulator of RNase III)